MIFIPVSTSAPVPGTVSVCSSMSMSRSVCGAITSMSGTMHGVVGPMARPMRGAVASVPGSVDAITPRMLVLTGARRSAMLRHGVLLVAVLVVVLVMIRRVMIVCAVVGIGVRRGAMGGRVMCGGLGVVRLGSGILLLLHLGGQDQHIFL